MLVMHAHNQVRQTQSKDLYVNALQDGTVRLNMDVAATVVVLHQQQCAGDQAYRSSQALHQQLLIQHQIHQQMSMGGGVGGNSSGGGGSTHASNKRARDFESTHSLHSYAHASGAGAGGSGSSSGSGGGTAPPLSQCHLPESQVHMTAGGGVSGLWAGAAGSSSSSSSSISGGGVSSSSSGGGGSNRHTMAVTVASIGFADLLLHKLQTVDIFPSSSSASSSQSFLFTGGGGGGGGSGQLPPAVAMHIEGLFLLVAALATNFPGGEFLTPVPPVVLTGTGLGLGPGVQGTTPSDPNPY